MAEPGSPPSSLRELLHEALLAGIGAVALTRERADELVEELVRRGRLSREEAEGLAEAVSGERADGRHLTERLGAALAGLFRELGLVTERERAELELRVAQLEHRLRLLERTATGRQGSAGQAADQGSGRAGA